MPWTNVQLLANVRDRTGLSTYNNATYNSENQNLVQGQIHSVSVNEVNFPYDIPNVQAGTTNLFALANNGGALPASQLLNIVIAPGFYNPAELVTAINNAIVAAAAAAGPPIPATDVPVLSYTDSSGRFTLTPPAAPVAGPQNWQIISPYTFYSVPTTGIVQNNKLGKDIFSLMGYLQTQGVVYTSGGNPNVRNTLYISNPGAPFIPPGQPSGPVSGGGTAPLVFTQYIDICSPELCQFQYFRDGSTTNLARRSDVICRLYISNNVATQEEEGARPFVINRQFNNARVMRWNTGSSVGSMSIQLYDDVGQPLQTTWQPRPYQITFNVYEQDKDGVTY